MNSTVATRLVTMACALMLLATPGRASAVTNGVPDTANAYPNTGALIVRSAAGNDYPICSGTLISASVFLTAAHCTILFTSRLEPLGYTLHVSFDNPIPWGDQTSASTNLIPVVLVATNPGYNAAQSDSGDIAVVTVDAARTAGITPATLPAAGALEALAAKNGLKQAHFVPVGYGLQDRTTGGGPPVYADANPVPRRYASSSFLSLNPGYLRLSQNPSTGDGGTCFGDSGGPNFLTINSVRTLVAITITGDSVCRATNVTYRLDTASARAFLQGFVTLP